MALNLKTLTAALGKDEILIPRLKLFLSDQHRLRKAKKITKQSIAVKDAKMTIAAFKERIDEFNHGEQPGEEWLFHPSSLGQCLKRLWFKHYNAPEEHTGGRRDEDIESYLTFETGTYFHVLFQNLCEAAGVLEAREVGFIDKKLRMIGHGDGILKLLGTKHLLEIKTINDRGFISLGDQPKHDHKRQATGYMKALGLSNTVFIYYNKNTSAVKELQFPFDPEFYRKEVRDRINLFFDHVASATPPPREGVNANDDICRYCPYVGTCFMPRIETKFVKTLRPCASNRPIKQRSSISPSSGDQSSPIRFGSRRV